MQSVLILALVALLLILTAFLFYCLGRGFSGARMIHELRERGWTVEPPDVEKEAASDAAVQ